MVTNRVTGMISGLDTETLVKQMMALSQSKYENIWKKKVETEWRKQLYTDIYKELESLDKKLFDATMSNFNSPKKAVSSNEAIAVVTASANATNLSHTLKVNQLAKGTSKISESNITTKTTAELHSTEKVYNADIVAMAGKLTLTNNTTGKSAVIDVIASSTFSDIADLINNAKDADGKSLGLEAVYDSNNILTISSKDTGDVKFTVSAGDGTTVNPADENLLKALKLSDDNVALKGKSNLYGQIADFGRNEDATFTIENTATGKSAEINLKGSNSISDLVSKINNAKDADGKSLGLKATYDANTDRLFINSTEMGADANFTITANDSGGTKLLDALNLKQIQGQDAVIELGGVEFNQKSNDFTLAGMTFSLKKINDPGDFLTVSVKSDTDKLVENVKGLLDSYNKLLELINGKTSEKIYRDYGPLTDEQKKEMSDKEIALWEEKAKSGVLRNDTILTGIATKMRTNMYNLYEYTDGKYKSLSSIGISTTDYKEKGRLTLDEDKFLKALDDDPDALIKLFGDATVIDPNDPDKDKKGLLARMRTDIKSVMRQMENKGGAGKTVDTESSWAKELTRYNKQLDAMTKKMKTEENRYYMQFAEMEKMLSSMNGSSSYLLSMFNNQ